MNDATLLLISLNFAYIGLLPRIFFKKGGSFNLNWWITASPLFVAPVFLLLVRFGAIAALPMDAGFSALSRVAALCAVPLSVLSIAMIALTMGSHRIPIALWHQSDDAPASIVTWGAYQRVRHPFYFSFLLAEVAGVLFFPHWVTLLSLLAGGIILNVTAAREERRLLASEFGREYADYTNRTWRLFPKLGAGES